MTVNNTLTTTTQPICSNVIHKWIQKLGILQGGGSNFLTGASDQGPPKKHLLWGWGHCAGARREWERKIWGKADAVKNQLFKLLGYVLYMNSPDWNERWFYTASIEVLRIWTGCDFAKSILHLAFPNEGKGFVVRNGSLRFGCVSQSPNSQNLNGGSM